MPEKYPHTSIYTINNLVDFHPGDRTLKNKITEKSVILQNPASFILLYLITNSGVVIPQARLVEAGWGEKNNITSVNTLYQTVLMLRNALTEVGLPRDLIRTVARRGMLITADIQHVENKPANEIENAPQASDDVARTRLKARFSRKTVMAGVLILSILLVGVGTSFSLFYPTTESLFSAYTIIDATSFSSCTILLRGKAALNTRYTSFLTRHKDICQNHNYVFLSGMSSAKNIAAVACQLDIRTNPSTKCTTWYSINDKN